MLWRTTHTQRRGATSIMWNMRTIMKIGFWLSLCSNWCLGETVSGMSMTKLSEGIKVTPLGQLYPTVAKWTSAVSLEPPRIHHSIKEAVRTLQYFFLNPAWFSSK